MKTLTIKLKQHTPLIHFQHDQEGATLRASEVKPKLDRFLLTKLGKGDYQQGIKIAKEKGWLIGKCEGHYALDYKIKIEETIPQIMSLSKMPLYFGNMGAEGNFKEMTFSSTPINLSIICSKTRYAKNDEEKLKEEQKEKDIIELIKNHISSFFVNHNFGTRQSKGFGSFTIIDYPLSLPNEYAIFPINNFSEFGTWDCFKNLFNSIDLFYKTIRSGINQNGVYLKSLMYHYAIDQGSYWDKRTIRYKFKHFKPYKDKDKGEIADQKNDGDHKEELARLYRDMLGLSSSQSWMFYGDTITKEHISKGNEEKIERFKSPLLFKPIIDDKKNKFDVYIIPTHISEQYYGSEFVISSENKEPPFKMKTPEDFNVSDYLQYFSHDITEWVLKKIKAINIDKIEPTKQRQAKKIQRILSSIYENIKYVNN